MRITLGTVLGSIVLLTESSEAQVIGVSPPEFSLVTQEKPWQAGDRQAVEATMNKYLYGGMDAQGLSRVEVCAEFIAGVIFVVVHPNNVRRACAWMEQRPLAVNDLGEAQRGEATARELLTMVTCMYGDVYDKKAGPMRDKFFKAYSKKIASADKVT